MPQLLRYLTVVAARYHRSAGRPLLLRRRMRPAAA